MRTLRIGSGAGFSGDRIDPAVELAAKGSISYLVFECLAERTIALAQKERLLYPESGYDPLLEERMEAILPLAVERHIRIISNMGAANPIAAARKTREIAERLRLRGVRIAAITGDDVLPLIRAGNFSVAEDSRLVRCLSEKLVSANAYLGAGPIVEALAANADIILTGRFADPSLFLAPLVHEFGWSMNDWNLLGQGTVIGHLLECAGQLTGGYFADPGYKTVPEIAHLGFPIAEVAADGTAIMTKVAGSGGAVTRATCIEQLLYEIQDPAFYPTPDVIADFSHVAFEEIGTDYVRVFGGRGKPRPSQLKVSVGYSDGYIGEAQISYAGPGALDRAKLAREILAGRLGKDAWDEMRFDFIGLSAILGERLSQSSHQPCEIRLRAVGRSESARTAALIPREVEALYTNGPAGGGGVMGSVRETIAILSALVSRDSVTHTIQYEVS